MVSSMVTVLIIFTANMTFVIVTIIIAVVVVNHSTVTVVTVVIIIVIVTIIVIVAVIVIIVSVNIIFYTIVTLHSFIYSFIHSDYFYGASSSPLLLRSAPDRARILCRNFTPKRHKQM